MNDVASIAPESRAARLNRLSGRRAPVLAELPFVGQPAVAQTVVPPASPLPTEPPAPSPRSFYVDPSHAGQHEHESNGNRRQRHERRSIESQPPNVSATPIGRVETSAGGPTAAFDLQSQVAPYAGLIVTLALVVAAGLMYWLIASPTPEAVDYFDLNPGMFGQPTKQQEQPPLVGREPSSFEPQYQPQFQTNNQPTFEPTEVLSPSLPVVEQNEPDFPATEHSDDFDFTRLDDQFLDAFRASGLRQLPAVARQPGAATIQR
jgi:hypothetical protein